jgi:hypothetical protein
MADHLGGHDEHGRVADLLPANSINQRDAIIGRRAENVASKIALLAFVDPQALRGHVAAHDVVLA